MDPGTAPASCYTNSRLTITKAEEAGRQLRSMLREDDTIQFFTSPYRRTRETTEGILRTLTADDPTPSPFPRNKIKVYEEPRLREQDFGNFQPCSAEMERMWQERADYGHFFYRIPNGESAADAYDRVSGFNESLWRQFGDDDFPSVCVLVTHGLMTRVFLMKWYVTTLWLLLRFKLIISRYHWSVEYFEDLRNVNHCEFITMKQDPVTHKYILENELRTWSDLKTRTIAAGTAEPSQTFSPPGLSSSPNVPFRRWGGCVNGCNHDKIQYPRRIMRKATTDTYGTPQPPSATPVESIEGEKDDHPIASQEADHESVIVEAATPKISRMLSTRKLASTSLIPPTPPSPNDASDDSFTSEENDTTSEGEEEKLKPPPQPRTTAALRHLNATGHLGVGADGFSDDSDYFPGMQHVHAQRSQQQSLNMLSGGSGTSLKIRSTLRQGSKDRKQRKMSEKSWMEESGMGAGAHADTLGDGKNRCSSPLPVKEGEVESEPILPEAYKGNMQPAEKGASLSEGATAANEGGSLTEEQVSQLKNADRKGYGEVY